ncbi:MAG: hypothetical protein ACTSYH_03360 [Candidatus Heimdallarchaeaceae archaeon]
MKEKGPRKEHTKSKFSTNKMNIRNIFKKCVKDQKEKMREYIKRSGVWMRYIQGV